MRIYDYHSTIANYETVHYFFKREKNTVTGNPRYRVWIIDGDGVVYETIFHCYEKFIESHVIDFIEKQ